MCVRLLQRMNFARTFFSVTFAQEPTSLENSISLKQTYFVNIYLSIRVCVRADVIMSRVVGLLFTRIQMI